ncbi:MAG TPA: site-2 protease family protein [Candidatus Omnitrophica bacterium]|nr:MAG: site-2 protease family protein [Candidatus Omnitrophota bacterium]RKY43592.1 MAG: site-2 protease family protein [Candidatus Omnitrophota bacterium]HEC69378.1 site-2 protease family protein [Candidatus Omnitrophota bacterium]
MIIILIIILFFSIIIHEVSHGYIAYRLGDPTAKYSGRLTLNPLVHIDLFGTILIPAFLILSHSPILFGWAKPVPINPYNFRNPRKDLMWVGFSGPASNLTIAFILSLIIKILPSSPITVILNYGAVINIVLAVINLIPIPPLDGSRILTGLLPRELAYKYMRIEPFGFIIAVLFIILFWRSIIQPIIGIICSLLGLNHL